MTGWNYRVMRHRIPDEHYEAIHEVHYDGQGNIAGWSKEAASPGGEDVKWVLDKMQEALAKPVIDYETGKEIE